MLHIIQDFVNTLLPAKRKPVSKGWHSFNGVCCIHNGESADKRGRAGMVSNADGSISYHCFNCQYKASYQPGRHLTFKFRKLLSWLGASDTDIKRLVIEAIRVKDIISPDDIAKLAIPEEKIEFKKRSLPEDARSFDNLVTFHELSDWQHNTNHLQTAIKYCHDRKINLQKYEFYLSDSRAHNLNQRVIIPCYWHKEIIGYTARALNDNVTPKYHNNYELNFVFNIDMQNPKWKFVIVSEGPFDAMAIDGVAVLHNEISEVQADIIDSLGKEVIVVADIDKSGSKLIECALKYGWNVSFPIWQEKYKDISKAVEMYGKLFVLKSIIDAKETNKLKIEILRKRKYS